MAAAALVELSQYVGAGDRDRYRAFAEKRLLALSALASSGAVAKDKHFLEASRVLAGLKAKAEARAEIRGKLPEKRGLPGADRASDLALAFHEQVIDVIVKECRLVREQTGANQVALTGGTFQNKILMEGALTKLRALGFEPYYNISVSPNDGGIALGQAFVAMRTGQ